MFGYSMGAGTGLQLAIRHPDKVAKLAAASPAYDARGFQPDYRAFVPQMTVDMFLGIPLRSGLLKARPKTRGISRSRQEADRAGA